MARPIFTFVILLAASGLLAILPRSFFDQAQSLALIPIRELMAEPIEDDSSRPALGGPQEIEPLRQRVHDLEQALADVAPYRRTPDAVRLATRIFLRGDSSSWHQTCYIDGGADRQFQVGSVVADRNGLIGTISAVFAHTSRVRLVTDPDSKIPASLISGTQNREPYLVTVEGDGGPEARLAHLARTEPVRPGDLVLTAASDSGCPAGLLIGTVTSVTSADSPLVHRVAIRPAADLHRVTQVIVFLPLAPPTEPRGD